MGRRLTQARPRRRRRSRGRGGHHGLHAGATAPCSRYRDLAPSAGTLSKHRRIWIARPRPRPRTAGSPPERLSSSALVSAAVSVAAPLERPEGAAGPPTCERDVRERTVRPTPRRDLHDLAAGEVVHRRDASMRRLRSLAGAGCDSTTPRAPLGACSASSVSCRRTGRSRCRRAGCASGRSGA